MHLACRIFPLCRAEHPTGCRYEICSAYHSVVLTLTEIGGVGKHLGEYSTPTPTENGAIR